MTKEHVKNWSGARDMQAKPLLSPKANKKYGLAQLSKQMTHGA